MLPPLLGDAAVAAECREAEPGKNTAVACAAVAVRDALDGAVARDDPDDAPAPTGAPIVTLEETNVCVKGGRDVDDAVFSAAPAGAV